MTEKIPEPEKILLHYERYNGWPATGYKFINSETIVYGYKWPYIGYEVSGIT